MNQLADFQMAHQNDESTEDIPATTKGRLTKVWKPPMQNGLNGNWDAVLDSVAKFTSFGFVVRDSFGEIQLSSSTSKLSNCHPSIAKAATLRHAMIISSEAGIFKIIFEGECQRVMHEVNFDSLCDSVLRPIV